MLSFSSAYSAQATGKNIVTDWLLELSYDSGTYYFSGRDVELTNRYHGLVEDWGAIDEKIDLANSSGSISDIEITLLNQWANASGLLSAELFGGSKKFINQDVVIKSYIPGVTLANLPTIYKGRLVDIQHSQETVTLSIEKRSPWAKIKIPTTKSSVKNIYFPEAYGDFTKNSSVIGTEDFITGKSLYPCPVNDVNGQSITPLITNVTYGFPSNVPFMHFYDKNLDAFALVENVAGWYTTAVDYQGGKAAYVDATLDRGFYYRPTTLTDRTQGFTDPSYAIDTDNTTKAYKTYSTTATTGNYFYIYIECPNVMGKITALDLYVKYGFSSGGLSTSTDLRLYDVSYGTSDPERNLIAQFTTNGSSTTNTASVDWYNADNFLSENKMPEGIVLQAQIDAPAGYLENGTVEIYDVYFDINAQVDFTDEQAAIEKLNGIDMLYCGNDSYTQGFTGGSGVASYPHDIFRDMLDRYAGWDASDIDDIGVNDGVWTDAIDTDRNWPCRWWTLEQTPLLDVLKKLQFEGAFIWVFDGTNYDARVIYVKLEQLTSGTLTTGKQYKIHAFEAGDDFTNVGASANVTGEIFTATGTTPTTWTNGSTLRGSYSDSDMDLDYYDLDNIKVSMTPFSEIVTKRTFNFQRHPADEKRYLQSNSLTNSNRGDYNLDAEENAIEQDLDFITASADADDLLEYYDNIVGEPKVIVQADLLKPADWSLQVGDIVQFTNMKYEPYGKTYADIYFMCTHTLRRPQTMQATFREVG